MAIKVIAVGRKHEAWVVDGVRRFEERLRTPFLISWELVAHSALKGDAARQDESEKVIKRLKPEDFVILLDERGKNIDSPAVAHQLAAAFLASRSVVVVIGGAYGVNDKLIKRADFVWSLSKLVFPHQLVRLILVEQIYRAQEITQDRPYHHE